MALGLELRLELGIKRQGGLTGLSQHISIMGSLLIYVFGAFCDITKGNISRTLSFFRYSLWKPLQGEKVKDGIL